MRQAAAPAVDAQGVCKQFVDKATRRIVHALQDVSMQAPHGALTALVGPDGAGKTTFLRLVAGLMQPQKGSIGVLGLDVGADRLTQVCY